MRGQELRQMATNVSGGVLRLGRVDPIKKRHVAYLQLT
jgi:hypothetical protein